MIYIPSKERWRLLNRSVNDWHALGQEVTAVIEPQYRKVMKEWYHCQADRVLYLPRNDRGIAFARQQVLLHAKDHNFKSIIMADDDQMLTIQEEGSIKRLFKLAERRDVVGIGTYRSLMGLYLGGTEMNEAGQNGMEGLFLHRGSIGYQIFAVNVKNALRSGGFDPRLGAIEDAELCRNGMNVLGLPWYIYTGVKRTNLLSKDGDDAEGGINALPIARYVMYWQSHHIIYKRWPEYISEPLPTATVDAKKRYRMAWKKMWNDYIGTSWPPEDIQTIRVGDWRNK